MVGAFYDFMFSESDVPQVPTVMTLGNSDVSTSNAEAVDKCKCRTNA
jgi:hypothetical protein